MVVGDMIKMVTGPLGMMPRAGLLIAIDRRHGADCNRHSRVATVLSAEGKLVMWPLDSHCKIEVISESR
jgi:hypothetical protein